MADVGVLSVQLSREQQSYFTAPLRRSTPSQSSLFLGSPPYSSPKPNYRPLPSSENFSSSSTNSSSQNSQADLTQPTPCASKACSSSSSSLTLDSTYNLNDHLRFPDYGGGGYVDQDEDCDLPPSPQTDDCDIEPLNNCEFTLNQSLDPRHVAEDDTSIRREPSRHVDYLSHEWREEDIWSSWRHIVANRKVYGEKSRFENASWRTWAKQKNKLKTVTPDTLNWLKDCDVTWLYGPLQTASVHHVSRSTSEPLSNMSKNNSFLTKKPILKKRSMSEVMLQKSISASSLVSQAAAAVQAQQTLPRPRIQHRPSLGRTSSDFVSRSAFSQPVSRDDGLDGLSSTLSTTGLVTPDQGERKHIRFDDKVEQCIALDGKDGDDDDDDDDDDNEESWASKHDSDSSSDDGLVMMKKFNKRKPLSRTNSKTNFSVDNKTIAKLEPTTLKYRTDSPDVPDTLSHSVGPSFWRRGNLSPSPSQETLRPSNPSRNFLVDEDDDEVDISWEPSGLFADRRDSAAVAVARDCGQDDPKDGSGGLRRTSSGMFMPYSDEDEEVQNGGLFGKIVDTINTAKDIAHVIWNVGWRA